MRYRALSASGDYTFGQGAANFLVNSPACVAQAIQTRLGLITGEWFLDETDGTPYPTQILGYGTHPFYDGAIRSRILGTLGMTGQPVNGGPNPGLASYSSNVTTSNRKLSVSGVADTIYGQAQFGGGF